MHMLMYVLFSTPTWCKGTVLGVYFGVMCTVLINDNNCPQSQLTYIQMNNEITREIFRRYNFDGFNSFTQMIHFLPRYEYIKELVH